MVRLYPTQQEAIVHKDIAYFEEMNAGLEMNSDTRIVTPEDVETFADLTGDANPIHIDDAHASESLYAGRIAHGALILSIATGLAYRLEAFSRSVEAITDVTWKFRHPVYVGDEIRARFTFRRKHSMPEYHGGLVVFDVEILNQDGEVVQEGRWRLLVQGSPEIDRAQPSHRKTNA
jgi:acyl dehydratase